ncbi:TraB/GumN family protein [Alloprevotella tannerae]
MIIRTMTMRRCTLCRPLIVLMFCLTSLSGLVAQAAPPTPADTIPSAIMYRISGKGLAQPSYLFGALHVLPHEFVTRSRAFMNIASGVDRIVTEVDVRQLEAFNRKNEAASKALMEQLLPHITLPADSQLQVVSPDAFHLVDSLIHHYHLEHYICGADSCWWRYDPGVIALPMQQMALYMFKAMGYGRMGMSPESKSQVIDLYMGTLADSLHKEYAQLESLEYQKEMLPSLIMDFSKIKVDSTFIRNFRTNIASMGNVAERAKLLLVVLSALENSCADWERLLTAYMAQDSRRAVDAMVKSNGEAIDQAAEKLQISPRNKRWLKAMRPMMKQKSTLFVVGLFHLTGVPSDQGILDALHQEGYTIEAVRL